MQNKLIDFAISYISQQTGTRVEANKIDLTFPNTFIIDGIYLEDKQQDTLLYAGHLSLQIDFIKLIKRNFHIRNFSLKDVYLNVYNSEQDSTFNYGFLIETFGDSAAVKNEKSVTIPWAVHADKFILENIRLRYVNVWDKLTITTQIDGFEVKETNLQFEEPALTCEDIILNANYLRYESGDKIIKPGQFNPNHINLNKVHLKARNLSFEPSKTSIEIQQLLAAEEDQGIVLRGFNALFSMDDTSMHIRHLTLKTDESYAHADIELNYDSLSNFADSFSAVGIAVGISKASLGKKEIQLLARQFIPNQINLPEHIDLVLDFKGKINSFEANLKLNSDFGSSQLSVGLDKEENFQAKLDVLRLDLGKLLKNNRQIGPVSFSAQAKGRGLSPNTIRLQLFAQVSQAYFKQYDYQQLTVNGKYEQHRFEGNIRMRDENLKFNLEGNINLHPGKENLRFNFDLEEANLQELKITEEQLNVHFKLEADVSGFDPDKVNGSLNISNLQIRKNNRNYELDSFLVETKNEQGKNELNLRSELIDLSYDGNISPFSLPDIVVPFFSNYFTGKTEKTTKEKEAVFNFDLNIHDHPLITDLLVPELDLFVPETISGKFNNKQQTFNIQGGISKAVYHGFQINDFRFGLGADTTSLKYKLNIKAIKNEQFHIENLHFEGKAKDSTATAIVSLVDSIGNKNLMIDTRILMKPDFIRVNFNPENFFVMNKSWHLNPEHYILVGKQGFIIHQLNLQHEQTLLSIHSVNEKYNDDIKVLLKHFNLDEISEMIANKKKLMGGILNGDILLKKTKDAYGIVADAKIDDFVWTDIPIGNLNMSVKNTSGNRFDVEGSIKGNDNNLKLIGYYNPGSESQAVELKADIESLSIKTIEIFSAGRLNSSSGYLTGSLELSGTPNNPVLSGLLKFKNVETIPTFLNSKITLSDESIRIDNTGIYFDTFTIKDINNHQASIQGAVRMQNFKDFVFDIFIEADNFQLFNTTAKDNELFYGRMLVDSKIHLTGPMELPTVNAKLKLREGSHVSFIIPRTELNTYKGEDVVVFESSKEVIGEKNQDKEKKTNSMRFRGADLTSVLEVDKNATLRLFMDPSSNDSLVVKGQADLNLTMDRSGKISLTGSYNLEEGSYQLTFESVIRKRFDIVQGSTIIWNGEPTDAAVNINAAYMVRTAPYNLIADQLGELTDRQKKSYLQTYPFILLLKMRGELLKPEIGFEIQLSPENQQILGGSVRQKLDQLNKDPSALNKQVFALLLLNSFIQENPLQTESAGTPAMLRSTVSSFLSEQLNKLSASFIPGVQMNFDLQSYEDYSGENVESKTELSVGIKKEMFDDRLSIQIGGTLELEGEKSSRNQATDITGDVSVEYKLTKDGRYRLKGFRKNQYDGLIDGQLTETGVGAMFIREFNKLKEMFKQ